MFHVYFISSIFSFFLFPLGALQVNGGMLSVAFLLVRGSLMLKPPSAIMSSPFSMRSSIPKCSVKNLSDALPPHGSDTKLNAPLEEIATKTLAVLWLL